MIRTLRDYLLIFAVLGILAFLVMNYIVMPIYVNWYDEVRVPGLTHTNLEEGGRILESHHLRWTVKDTIFRVDIVPGFIMDQFPEAGQMVKENRRIQLTISLPPPKQEMPNLVATTERQARIALEELGLVIKEVLEDSSDYFERTVVMEQSIPAGVPVAVGDSLILTVSLGKRNLKKIVPELLNQGLNEATRMLDKTGFTLGTVTYISNHELLPNTVVSQSESAGKIFPREREIRVDLVVTTD